MVLRFVIAANLFLTRPVIFFTLNQMELWTMFIHITTTLRSFGIRKTGKHFVCHAIVLSEECKVYRKWAGVGKISVDDHSWTAMQSRTFFGKIGPFAHGR